MGNELIAAAAAALCLGAALLTVFISQRFLQVENTGVLLVLIGAPVLVYLVVSGKISEFAAPGGFEARFLAIARKPVEFVDRTLEASVQPAQIAERGRTAELPDRLSRLERFEPVILTVKLGQAYDRRDWLEYVNALLEYPQFALAALLDENDRLLAFMGVGTVHELLSNAALGGELVRLIEQGELQHIIRFPGVHQQRVSPRSSAIEALRRMRGLSIEVLPVVDAQGSIVGIVTMQEIIAQIIVDLVEQLPNDG